MNVDNMTLYKMTVDKMNIDNKILYKMTVDEMTVDKYDSLQNDCRQNEYRQ